MIQISIRRAIKKDAEVLSQISFLASKGDSETGFYIRGYTAEEYEKEIEDSELMIAEIKGNIVGYICIDNTIPDYVKEVIPIIYHNYRYVSGLCIHPDYHRIGVARALKKYTCRYNCISEVFVYPSPNNASIRMNLALGWDVIGIVKDSRNLGTLIFCNKSVKDNI